MPTKAQKTATANKDQNTTANLGLGDSCLECFSIPHSQLRSHICAIIMTSILSRYRYTDDATGRWYMKIIMLQIVVTKRAIVVRIITKRRNDDFRME